jgi:hypothetical protein
LLFGRFGGAIAKLTKDIADGDAIALMLLGMVMEINSAIIQLTSEQRVRKYI